MANWSNINGNGIYLYFCNTSDCRITWTAGWTRVIGSLDMSDWQWNITDSLNQPVNYTAWGDNEPNNSQKAQDVIIVADYKGYKWADVTGIPASNYDGRQACYVCELEV